MNNQIDKESYTSWIDSYFLLFPKLHYIYVSISTGIAIFAIAIIYSLFFNFFKLYIKTYQSFLVILGIIWVMCWIRWGTTYLIKYLNKLIDEWGIKDNKDFVNLDKNLKLFTKNSILITNSILFTLIVFGGTHLHLSKSQFLLPSLFISSILPAGWYEASNLLYKEILIFFTLIIPCFLVATTGNQIVIFSFKIVTSVCKIFHFEMPNIAAKELKPLSIISLKTAFSWFVGVGIITVAFIRGLTPIILVILGILTLIGLLVFFLPHYRIHRILLKRRDELVTKIMREYKKFISPSMKSELNLDKIRDLFYWNSIFQDISNSKTWAFDMNILMQLISASVIPFLSLVIKLIILNSIS